MISCGRLAPVPVLPAKPTGTWLCAVASKGGLQLLSSCELARRHARVFCFAFVSNVDRIPVGGCGILADMHPAGAVILRRNERPQSGKESSRRNRRQR